MPGKKGAKALREEGLQKTDNNLELTTWPQVQMINQKNYYTEYLKRDDQYLAYRTLEEERTSRMVREARDKDRALAQTSNEFTTAQNGDEDEDMDENENEPHGSKIIVIHPGSQNLRIGFANDALPKTVPMCIARKWKENETEEHAGEPRPKRVKIDNEEPERCDKLFGAEFATQYNQMSQDLKIRMRNNKRRLLPNSKELVVNYNKRTAPETIPVHNDPQQIDWTEINAKSPDYLVGQAALRIPEKSRPRYKLFWPMQNGWMNEKDYRHSNLMWTDFFKIIEEAMKSQLGLKDRKEWSQYSCVFVIPDLYERMYVTQVLDTMLRDFDFRRLSFMQESLASSFGAGYSISCIVDIGAQKTSICCVEDGMCIEESRMNLKYGGADVTELFMKMMLFDYFPYADINLRRRYDWILAEELKQKFCTMNEAEISVQLYEFHLRASGQDTRKYTFKTYDETMLAPMGYFQPQIFDHSGKLDARRKIFDRSYDLYDGTPNDPQSAAQDKALEHTRESIPAAVAPVPTPRIPLNISTPNGKLQSFNLLSRPQFANETGAGTPRDSTASSPAPEGTPKPENGAGSPGPNGDADEPPKPTILRDPILEAEVRDRTLPLLPLDQAIRTSIWHGARADDRKARDFYGGIMVVGGGAKIPGFNTFLETKLRESLPGFTKEILIGLPPRELDQQLVTWKGGSVFGRLSSSGNDGWIYTREYELLGAKLLAQKCMWNY